MLDNKIDAKYSLLYVIHRPLHLAQGTWVGLCTRSQQQGMLEGTLGGVLSSLSQQQGGRALYFEPAAHTMT